MVDHNTLERPETLYITDAELIRRMGVPEKIARATIKMLDEKAGTGFPKKQKLWGGRRYWPAVKAYLDTTNGLNGEIDAARLIPENRARTRLPRRHPAEPRGGQPHDA